MGLRRLRKIGRAPPAQLRTTLLNLLVEIQANMTQNTHTHRQTDRAVVHDWTENTAVSNWQDTTLTTSHFIGQRAAQAAERAAYYSAETISLENWSAFVLLVSALMNVLRWTRRYIESGGRPVVVVVRHNCARPAGQRQQLVSGIQREMRSIVSKLLYR